jgi:hypothetical protein
LNNGIIFTGNSGNLDATVGLPQNTPGSRLMWVPQKSAFFAGTPGNSTTWNYGNLGLGAVGLGYNLTTDNSNGIIAMGYNGSVSGLGGVALGYAVSVSGNSAAQWGNYSIPVGTVAIGYYAISSGVGDVAIGRNTTAAGGGAATGSVAIGSASSAAGLGSIALGTSNGANSDATIAIGYLNTTGTYNSAGAAAMGSNNTVWGTGALAMGTDNNVNGYSDVALGRHNQTNFSTYDYIATVTIGDYNSVTGQNSAAIGANNTINAASTFALGNNLTALTNGTMNVDNAFIAGQWNANIAGLSGNSALFVIGNGTSGNRSNAFTILKNGNTTVFGTLTVNGNTTFAGNQTFTGGTIFGTAPVIGSASATGALAIGTGITAQNWGEVVVGHYNQAITGNTSAWASQDPAFIVGIGQNGTTGQANGLTLLNNGILYSGTGNYSNLDGTTGLLQGAGTRLEWIPQKYALLAGSPGNATSWDYGNIGVGSVAIGYNLTSSSSNGTVAMGYNNAVSGPGTIALGNNATTKATGNFTNGSIAIGNSVTAIGDSAIAIGSGVTSNMTNALNHSGGVAIGGGVSTKGFASVVIGYGSSVEYDGGIALGYNVFTGGDMWGGPGGTSYGASAIGWGSKAVGQGAVAIGMANWYSNGDGAVAIGKNEISGGTGAIALGYYNNSTTNFAISLGGNNVVSGTGSAALGTNLTVTTDHALVAGQWANITGTGGNSALFALGNGSSAGNLSTAFTVLKNGNTTINGVLTLTGANGSVTIKPSATGTFSLADNSGNTVVIDPTAKSLAFGGTTLVVSPDGGLGLTNGTIHGLASGNASVPAVNFSGDSDTGVFSPGANILALSTNGTEQVRLDANGYFGVGQNAMSYKFEIYGAQNLFRAISNTHLDAIWQSAASSQLFHVFFQGSTIISRLGFTTGGVAEIRTYSKDFQIIDNTSGLGLYFKSSGNIGIGTTNPSYKLDVSGTTRVTGLLTTSGGIDAGNNTIQNLGAGNATVPAISFNNGNSTGVFSPANNALALSANGTERLRVDAAGNVTISGNTTLANPAVFNGTVTVNGNMTVKRYGDIYMGNFTNVTADQAP